MLRKDWSLRSGHPRSSQRHPLLRSRQSDSLRNATADTPGNDLLRDIKPYPRYAPAHVGLRSYLPWSHARLQRLKHRASLPAHATARNIRAPAKQTPPKNPFERDIQFEWNPQSIILA